MPPPVLSRRKRWAFRLILLVIALCLPVAAGEAVVRVIYRDGGTTTLNGPGGKEFEYHFIDAATERRTRATEGPKAPGVERVLVLGDSITWGIGIRDWRHIYPNLLLNHLDQNGTGRKFDMEVFAYGGKNIDGHARAVQADAESLAPDYIIYQWYNNDIEIDVQGPRRRLWWQQWSLHPWLAQHSWLYWVIDRQASQAAVAKGWGGPSYAEHLNTDYAEGSDGWTLFMDQFHRWAAYSTAYARHVLMFLYPQVPFTGAYPLEALNTRMRALAAPHLLTYPGWWTNRRVGRDIADAKALGGRLRQSDGHAGLIADGPAIPLRAGHYDIKERVRLDAPANGPVESIEVIGDGHLLASRVVDAAEVGAGGWATITIGIDLHERLTKAVEWRVNVPDQVRLSIDSIAVPVDYAGLEVLDLKDRLNTFDTHASIFDSHPNSRAHAEIAKVLTEWILSKRPEQPPKIGTR
jgi:hypothetical protein